jgi:hypothetical protein
MNPNDQLAVTLEAQQWNVVLATLAEGPFRIVAPLMQEIQRQLTTEPSTHHPKTNGAETREPPP